MSAILSETKISSLIPHLSDQERQDMVAYYTVYEKHAENFSAWAREDLKDHPVFGPIIKGMPKEEAEKRDELSRKLQNDAIMNDNWLPFIEDQTEQGRIYARMGLDFKAWYEVIALLRNYMMPYLHREYGNGPDFLAAVSGMNRFMEIAMAVIGEAYVSTLNEDLEEKVRERTAQLESVNKELEAFAYSVSHDLRAPLRAINGYAEILGEDYGKALNEEGKRVLQSIKQYATTMGTLIDQLLAFSRLGRKQMQHSRINMNELVQSVLAEIDKSMSHQAKIKVNPLPEIYADYTLMHQVMFNLISNAVKYSSKKEAPQVEISGEEKDREVIISVKDNGAGFDMQYADKLFGVFQRLHNEDEFEGTGVGLAIVHRVITRHGGRIWADAKPDEGATFSFALSSNPR